MKTLLQFAAVALANLLLWWLIPVDRPVGEALSLSIGATILALALTEVGWALYRFNATRF